MNWNSMTEEDRVSAFKCPDGRTNFDAVCPKCEKYNDCEHGHSKHWGPRYSAMCGCGGASVCDCGWDEEWCFRRVLVVKEGEEGYVDKEVEACPYCGRDAKMYRNKIESLGI